MPNLSDLREKCRNLVGFMRHSASVRHTLVYTLASGVGKAMPFIFLPFITQALTPAGYGVWAMYLSLFIFCLPLLGSMLTQYIAKTYNTASAAEQSAILSNTFGISGLLSLALLAFGALWWAIHGPSFVALSLCTLPFFCWLNITRETFHYLLKARFQSAVFAVAEVGYTLLFYGIALALLTGSLAKMVPFTAPPTWHHLLCGALVAQVCAVVGLWRYFTKKYHLRLALHLPTAKTLLLFTLPLMPHALAAATMSLTDRLLVERLLSLEALGIYAVGVQLAMSLQVYMASVQNMWQPWALQHASRTGFNPAHPFNGLRKHVFLYFGSIIGVGAAVAIAGTLYLLLAFDAVFQAAIPVMLVMLFSLLLRSVYTLAYPFLLAANQLPKLQWHLWICALLNAAIAAALIPTFGMVGAAWGSVFGFAYFSLFSWKCLKAH